MLLVIIFYLVFGFTELNLDQQKDLALSWYQKTDQQEQRWGIVTVTTPSQAKKQHIELFPAVIRAANRLKAPIHVIKGPSGQTYMFLVLEPQMQRKLIDDPRQPSGETFHGKRNKYYGPSRMYALLRQKHQQSQVISPYVWLPASAYQSEADFARAINNEVPFLSIYRTGLFTIVHQLVNHNRIRGALDAGIPIAVNVIPMKFSANK